MVLRLSATIVGMVWWVSVASAGLEIPAPHSAQTGVRLISGWVCDAEELEVSFDGGARLFVPYGSERVDTREVCGDTDNGFGLLINYNNLGEGAHTVTLYVDGEAETTRTFTVVTLGEPFIRGLEVDEDWYTAFISFRNGPIAEVVWDEAMQNFAIVDYFTLDDWIGKWEFRWSPPYVPGQRPSSKTAYFTFTHTTIRDERTMLIGRDATGNEILGGYVTLHLSIDYSRSGLPQPLVSIPRQIRRTGWYFWVLDRDTDTQGNPICAFFLFDMGSADELPPAEPIQRGYGELFIVPRNGSTCVDTGYRPAADAGPLSVDRIE